MKVSIEEISREQDEEIIIRCHEVNDDIDREIMSSFWERIRFTVITE